MGPTYLYTTPSIPTSICDLSNTTQHFFDPFSLQNPTLFEFQISSILTLTIIYLLPFLFFFNFPLLLFVSRYTLFFLLQRTFVILSSVSVTTNHHCFWTHPILITRKTFSIIKLLSWVHDMLMSLHLPVAFLHVLYTVIQLKVSVYLLFIQCKSDPPCWRNFCMHLSTSISILFRYDWLSLVSTLPLIISWIFNMKRPHRSIIRVSR